MARTNLVFSKSGKDRHVVQVDGDAERTVETLRNGWAQLNQAKEGDKPQMVWVNAERVLYVEDVGESVYQDRESVAA